MDLALLLFCYDLCKYDRKSFESSINTVIFLRYGSNSPVSLIRPRVVSALAIFEEMTSMRNLWAVSALALELKALNIDISNCHPLKRFECYQTRHSVYQLKIDSVFDS